ncbi:MULTISPECIES: hypothetical protein [Aneurinibacillus]|uniref:hypothetical protein n=1 Tax=Aneurinibacillus TaxID=55079 RepID=UPI0012E34EC3|nr:MULTISPECIES: hypothetical protein [Aneurinibacillus]MED0737234.1 hypothetical protein [Aneurinibacillus thermoaerophilus]
MIRRQLSPLHENMLLIQEATAQWSRMGSSPEKARSLEQLAQYATDFVVHFHFRTEEGATPCSRMRENALV